jgi:hypothetical protein
MVDKGLVQYCEIKKMIEKYGVFFRDCRDYEAFIKELARVLNI